MSLTHVKGNVNYTCMCDEQLGFKDEGNDGRYCIPENGQFSLINLQILVGYR